MRTVSDRIVFSLFCLVNGREGIMCSPNISKWRNRQHRVRVLPTFIRQKPSRLQKKILIRTVQRGGFVLLELEKLGTPISAHKQRVDEREDLITVFVLEILWLSLVLELSIPWNLLFVSWNRNCRNKPKECTLTGPLHGKISSRAQSKGPKLDFSQHVPVRS